MVYCNALSAFLVPIAGYWPLSTKNAQILVVRGGVAPVGGRPPLTTTFAICEIWYCVRYLHCGCNSAV